MQSGPKSPDPSPLCCIQKVIGGAERKRSGLRDYNSALWQIVRGNILHQGWGGGGANLLTTTGTLILSLGLGLATYY